ncbi:MAG: Putative signal transduction protein [Petrotoga mobilis]|nr:MAG: Putative signal transduction protein [Petrotoga mobilis]
MNDKDIKALTKKINELPTPDFIVQRIIDLANDPEANTNDLHNMIVQSPALTAKILRLVNSAYYALPKRVTKLSQAINLLGFKTVRNLALSIFTVENYFSEDIPFFNTQHFWVHLISTGLASELLARYLNFPDKEEVFMCGVLHDLSKVVMAHIMPDVFEMIIKVAKHEKISFFQAENLLSTYSHQQIGRKLFENWNMSELVIETATYHDNPLESQDEEAKKILYIVNVGNITTNLYFYGYSGSFDIPEVDLKVWNFLGLNYNKYSSYFEEFKDIIKRSPEFTNMKEIFDDLEVTSDGSV